MDVTNPSPPGGSKNRRPDAIGGLRRDDRFARRVALQWRRLIGSGGSRTLIACSGGADSTALLLALALASRELVVGHVLHDLRARADAEADRDFVRVLADRLGLPFVEAEVRVAACPGNAESNARRERYRSLARLASAHNCLFVATAHHADDQFETMLMALTRGCGPGGLRGIAPSRVLPESETDRVVTLIRPMLHVTRAEARAACASAGIAWREDRTNTDTS
ncbi:MAG: tRNA lysidine(34) synthetase TilS, partial [Phycisphaerae bacterium]|nr:tRNA lysidine(34) synthetase TilS [Phycisphaerae bacterium]